MALTGLGAVKKPSAIGSGDIWREAAGTTWHVSPPFLLLLLLPRHAKGDFFPLLLRPGKRAVLGYWGAERWLCRRDVRLLLEPWERVFYQRVGKAYGEGFLELRNKGISTNEG